MRLERMPNGSLCIAFFRECELICNTAVFCFMVSSGEEVVLSITCGQSME